VYLLRRNVAFENEGRTLRSGLVRNRPDLGEHCRGRGQRLGGQLQPEPVHRPVDGPTHAGPGQGGYSND
jgi:hypothetical protein